MLGKVFLKEVGLELTRVWGRICVVREDGTGAQRESFMVSAELDPLLGADGQSEGPWGRSLEGRGSGWLLETWGQ